MSYEVEKRYLLSALPVIPQPSDGPFEYTHGFLPGTTIKERVTIRPAGPSWKRTVKVGSGVRRFEFAEDLDEKTFDFFWPLTQGRRVRAKRWKVTDEKLTQDFGKLDGKPLRWEVTQFTDRALHLAEIELPTEVVVQMVGGSASVPGLEFPDWLKRYVVKDVTDDEQYEAFNLGQ